MDTNMYLYNSKACSNDEHCKDGEWTVYNYVFN